MKDDVFSIYSKDNVRVTKRRVKEVARELCYPKSVMVAIDMAKTNDEVASIMQSARCGKYE